MLKTEHEQPNKYIKEENGLFYDKSVFKVIIFASIIIIISISLMGYIVYTIAHNEVVHKLKNNDLEFISQSIASKVTARIDRAKESSLILASDPQVIHWIKSGENNKQIEGDVLNKLNQLTTDFNYTKSFIASAITNHYWSDQGRIIETLSKDDPFDDWFFQALDSEQQIIMNIDYNAQYDETFVWMNTLIRDRNQSLAVVGVGLDLNELSREFQSFAYGKGSNLWLVDNSGKIYLSNHKSDNGHSIEEFVPLKVKDKVLQKLDKNNHLIEYEDTTGKTMDLITHQLQISDLKLVFQIPRNETISFLNTVKLNTFIAILISLISIVFIFYFVSKRLANPYKRALELNRELDKIVEERTLELTDKNEKIMDSILYAKRIQKAVLPSQSSFEQICEDHFIVWKPRDGVGGDFFWTAKIGEDYLLAIGDCTGHGVPGALMTMLSISILNNISEHNDDKYKNNPAAILTKLNTVIKETLNQKSKRGMTDDGLDIGLCYIKPGKEIIYSGAKLSLYKRDSKELIEYKGERKSIGYRRTPFDFQYKNYRIEIGGDEIFYLTTDGLIDQNGEDTEFGFGKKRFKELINTYFPLQIEEQKRMFEKELFDYMKSAPQRDDVTFVGFKVQEQKW